MNEDLVRARIRVTGVVQGVGFRYFVRSTAVGLGIGGYVRNRPDGSVEVVAEGDRHAMSAFLGELRVGPRHASIAGADVEWLEPRKDFTGFEYKF
jgi:acylphosphatase